ncbi:MAG: hypothetical protein LBM73_03450 [Candidatus Nomurabacteria bacterium]|jgi:signal transduction histidine kinase|nr:hypothetical protein [Candidatus Nomurabacteria bacterium]
MNDSNSVPDSPKFNARPTLPRGRLDRFWPLWRQRIIGYFVGGVILIAALTILIWVLLSLSLSPAAAAIVAICSCAILTLLAGLLIFQRALRPLQILTDSIVQISGQTTAQPAPILTDKILRKCGLDDLVNLIYDISNLAKTKPGAKLNSLNEKVLQALPVGVIVLDADQKIVWHNDSAPISHSGGEKIQLLFDSPQDSIRAWLDAVGQSQIAAVKTWRDVPNLPAGADGQKIYDVLASYRRGDPDGLETIIVALDRTAEYNADAADRDFIALAAHELRGPITVIRGYLDSLKYELDPAMTAEQKSLFDRVLVSSNRLAGYVNNVLQASHFERRQMRLNQATISIQNIINDIKSDVELRANTLNRQLIWQIQSDLPAVYADPSAASEVLTNLIDNAIKYSKDGGEITITAAPDSDPSFVKLSVIDHGIGIPSDILPHLFQKFYRSHRSKTAIGGSGLGLYISRAIVESGGGQISVDSREGAGSTFSFTLPTAAGLAEKPGADDNNFSRISGGWIKNHGKVVK